MVSVCLPSDALLQYLPSYLVFSYLGSGVSLHGCSSKKAQLLLLTLDEGYLLTAAVPDLQRGIAPLGPPVPAQPPLLWLLLRRWPWPWAWVAPPHRPWLDMVLCAQSCPTLWTVAYQAPLFMGFLRQEYCTGLPFPTPGDLLNPGTKPASPVLAGRCFTTEPPGKPHVSLIFYLIA